MSDERPGLLAWGAVIGGAALLALSVVSGIQAYLTEDGPRVVEVVVPKIAVPEPPPLPADETQLRLTIPRGGSFGALVDGYDVPAATVRNASLDLYDLSKVRPGRDLELHWVDGEAAPVSLSYAVDEDRTLMVIREGEVWSSRLDEVSYVSSTGQRSFTIERSLWRDGLEAGLRPNALARLAKIFEYELDFNTELRQGARFAVVAEVLQAPNRKAKLGQIYAVRLSNGGKTWTVIQHDIGGKSRFFHDDGRSLRRPFLRSPLEFSRVTSGFNPKRYHPVLKRRRPHNGTDFGAPSGTPVRVVADGRVVRAGWSGGHGKFVKVEHGDGYATSYSHLSAISVKKGAAVRQGQLVGRVGSTGMSTGPHLHFQMWKNKRFIDPMKTKLPQQSPLPASEKAAFGASKAKWMPLLEQAWSQTEPAP